MIAEINSARNSSSFALACTSPWRNGKRCVSETTGSTTAPTPFDLRVFLRAIDLFAPLDAAGIDELTGELEWLALPGGATLFAQGDVPDALYILKSGSLG